jgi:hypothetical protein
VQTIDIFINHFANAASVLGFFLSLAGFGFTLFELRVISEKTRKAEEIARHEMDQLALQMLAFESSKLNYLMKELFDVCMGAIHNWPRAIEKCQQIRAEVTRLIDHPKLLDEERRQFRSAYDDFGVVIEFIHKSRMNGPAIGADLPALKKKTLNDMASTFLRIESRLRHSPFEA